MSLPVASLIWHCPYILLFYSDSGLVDGENYREYALIKMYGENEIRDDYAENTTVLKDSPGKAYVALTGDRCALTDIRVR